MLFALLHRQRLPGRAQQYEVRPSETRDTVVPVLGPPPPSGTGSLHEGALIDAAPQALSERAPVTAAYLAIAGVATLGFAAAGALLATTLPYHQWDSFGFGEWSRAIAEHSAFDPTAFGPLTSSRPLFFELQGVIWKATGVSFAAGRLLSLAFALLLVGSVFRLQLATTRSRLEAALAVAVLLSIPTFAGQSLSGQTDVPAAATVALAAALALWPARGRVGAVAICVTAALAVLTKQTALIALTPFAIVLFAFTPGGLAGRLRTPVGALVAGLAVGLSYDVVMASRFNEDLRAFLTTGSTGIWAELAARARADAILRADVLGTGLRLPLTFALVYAIARLVHARHRHAAPLALLAGLSWSIAGPLAAGVHHGAFDRPEDALTLIGFALILGALWFLPDDEAPTKRTLALSLALGLPPLLVWAQASAYTDRLAATGWAGLAVLIACLLGAGIRGLARAGTIMALAPVPILAMALWMSLANFDGLHGAMWAEYRSLGRSGLQDRLRTMHVVLPALESTLATAEQQLGTGRLVTGDPMFPYFLPGRVDTKTPARCEDLRGYRVFVLLTGDESLLAAREAGRLATPEEWAACRAPAVHQLSDGNNGYAVFAVDRA